jgi:hypothetical protein
VDDVEREDDLVNDPFERAYGAGVLDEDPSPAPSAVSRAAAAAGQPFALRRCVIKPEERFGDGVVVVHGSAIASVGAQQPDADVRVVDTSGVILPGLIDLHGRPEFNVFAAWEPPRLYRYRYQWRRSQE